MDAIATTERELELIQRGLQALADDLGNVPVYLRVAEPTEVIALARKVAGPTHAHPN